MIASASTDNQATGPAQRPAAAQDAARTVLPEPAGPLIAVTPPRTPRSMASQRRMRGTWMAGSGGAFVRAMTRGTLAADVSR
ncbi:hypothetical protein FrCorBMG51_23675 [Protofrankia coriariae]|uniref:Phosphoglycerate kinase n=1 Tax=Protofrankia coriariae TaxID=1562887 RepID=A0ABR5EYT8_9ACTN|nr:hypothetical protein FrCorBMG51_23675 [Protofrankia coriariae]